MLIEFSVGNFRSFKEKVTLSMVAANITSQNKSLDENNIIQVDDRLKLVTSAVLYGSNASGKSNWVRAFNFMKGFIRSSSRESQADERIDIEPFRLSTITENQASHFEVVFILDGARFRYGFELTPKRVEREWLYRTATIREANLFTRENDEIHFNQRSFKEGRGLPDKTRSNALFLSVVAQFNGPISLSVQKWFQDVGFISGINDIGYRQYTADTFIENAATRDVIRELVKSLDLNIDQIKAEKIPASEVSFPPDMPEEIKSFFMENDNNFYSVSTLHKKFDEEGKEVSQVTFNLDDHESDGTQKLFYLAGPLVDKLINGGILIIDEMEARLHPLLTCAIIGLFNSKKSNPKNAQLIFTTHDTNLLDRDLFRRDQIWFVEKDNRGASHIYSLVEFKPRYDASYAKNYLQGRYGAVPFLGNLRQVFEDRSEYLVDEAPANEP